MQPINFFDRLTYFNIFFPYFSLWSRSRRRSLRRRRSRDRSRRRSRNRSRRRSRCRYRSRSRCRCHNRSRSRSRCRSHCHNRSRSRSRCPQEGKGASHPPSFVNGHTENFCAFGHIHVSNRAKVCLLSLDHLSETNRIPSEHVDGSA